MDQPRKMIESDLFDHAREENGQKLYENDCCNVLVCKSYGALSYCCLAGANVGNRCSYAEKMQLIILNDSNPNATYKPKKPTLDEVLS